MNSDLDEINLAIQTLSKDFKTVQHKATKVPVYLMYFPSSQSEPESRFWNVNNTAVKELFITVPLYKIIWKNLVKYDSHTPHLDSAVDGMRALLETR